MRTIAVFGRNSADEDELAAARRLGVAVTEVGAVLLTGGDRRPGPARDIRDIKDAAVGAADEAATDAAPAAWIGVANEAEAAPARRRGPRSWVVTPGWRHRRNFVEACLCDAAIAIGGESEGTASEALFALYLGRPLVVVGSLPDAERSARALLSRAARRIPEPEQEVLAVDRGIRRAYAWAAHADDRVDVRPLPLDPGSASALVALLLDAVGGPPRPRVLEALADETDWDRFVARTLSAARRDAP